ncbi:hypothetical protein [Paraburkholderia sp. J67]|uniref:hypothetical protein n=1 Tax=Paraburkholderia sp. J67 TaxID=2805435 RepID=UPI002ABD19AC|nr:hypothetical protein [Paraburkholderia sp. J67]
MKPDFQPQLQIEHEASSGHRARRSFPKVIWLVVLAVGLVYAAYLLLGANPKPESTPDDSGVHSSGGSISSATPAQPTNTTLQSTATPPPPSVTAQQPAPQPAAQPATQFADVPESLRAARASLAAHSLSDAKAADAAALARDPNNNDARDVQRDIAGREQQRDSALQNADRCVNQHDWACAQQQASQALAIDSSSPQAQAVMEHAILASAWAPASAAAPSTTPSNQATPTPNPGADARQRAIVQYGWKQAAPPNATH